MSEGCILKNMYVCLVYYFTLMFQVIKGSEILEVLHSLPKIRNFLFSLYDCRYAEFFRMLGKSRD